MDDVKVKFEVTDKDFVCVSKQNKTHVNSCNDVQYLDKRGVGGTLDDSDT